MTVRSQSSNVARSAAVIAPDDAMSSAANTKPGAVRPMISDVWQSPSSGHVCSVEVVVVDQARRKSAALSA